MIVFVLQYHILAGSVEWGDEFVVGEQADAKVNGSFLGPLGLETLHFFKVFRKLGHWDLGHSIL